MENRETIEDYFENGRATEFIHLMRGALVSGWEQTTGNKFIPCKAEFNCKHGRLLVTSYEAAKSQKVDLFLAVIKQIGSYIAKACENCAEYSDFVIDWKMILSKQFEHAAIYVFCNKNEEQAPANPRIKP